MLHQAPGDEGNCLRGDVPVDQQGLTGIAYPHPLGLCIKDDLKGHIHICGGIHVDMAVAGAGFNDRHRRMLHYGTDQSGASPWDQHIHQAPHSHEGQGALPVRPGKQGDGLLRKACFRKPPPQGGKDGLIAPFCCGAPLQDTGASGFEAEGKGVCRYIGPCLIDHADHPEGDTDLSDHKAVWSCKAFQDPSYRVLQSGYGSHAGSHIGDPLFRQGEPVQQALAHALVLRLIHVLPVGEEDLLTV